jgi:predicted RNA-binding Zn-ribbon protein involved in translation (DUF1610 family)
MNQTVDRCESCGGLVDVEDLFCANCGTTVPDRRASELKKLATEAKNFQCKGCGASMNYDASAQTLKCPFCGSVDLIENKSPGILAPDCVIPFAIDQGAAEQRLRSWLGSSFWHPGDLRTAAQLTELRAVYVPFWVFTTNVKSYWTADTSEVPLGASASWFPISGACEREYHGVWIAASAGIRTRDLNAIGPFDTKTAIPPESVDLADVTVEQFTVSRRYARPLAQAQLEIAEAQALDREAPGRNRNIHVNLLMEGADSQAALAPVYVMAYRYRDHVYQFVVNGQNGRSTGTAPVSIAKIAGVIGIVILVALIALMLLR